MVDKIDCVEFYCDRGKLGVMNLKVFVFQENFNKSSQLQLVEFFYSEIVRNISIFIYQWGILIFVLIKFSCELLIVVKGEISILLIGLVFFIWGKLEMFEKIVFGKYFVIVVFLMKVICEVVVYEVMMEMFYIIYFKFGKRFGGMWKGVLIWDVKMFFKEEKFNLNMMN